MTSQSLCSSLSIAINSSLCSNRESFGFNFFRLSFKALFFFLFLSAIFPLLMYMCEIMMIIIEKNWMKVEQVKLFYNEVDEVKISKF